MNKRYQEKQANIANCIIENMTIDEVKRTLKDYLVYFEIMNFLVPDRRISVDTNFENFLLSKINSEETKKTGYAKIVEFNRIYRTVQTYFPLKVRLADFSNTFNEILETRKGYAYITIEELHKLIDINKLSMLFIDQPLHAKIILTTTSPQFHCDERFLLGDAFYMYLKAELADENSTKFKAICEISKNDDAMLSLQVFNQNVATYSRLSCVSFYAFVEAFVNSVGYDFCQRNIMNLTPDNISKLKGEQKDSLKWKLQKFPSIIRTDNREIFNTLDDHQIRDPFKSFFDNATIRHLSVHYKPHEGSIFHAKGIWVNTTKKIAQLSLDVALKFWEACYPDRDAPEYLDRLDFHYWFEHEKKRAEQEVKNLDY